MNAQRMARILFVFTALIAGAASAGFVDLSSATLPVCSSNQVMDWNGITNNYQGVLGRDTGGSRIGTWGLDDTTFFDERLYYPFDGYKHTVCGTLHRYNFYDAWGAEADWNNFLVPTSTFAGYLDMPKAWGSREIHDCAGISPHVDNCMEGEITPDEAFYDSYYFPKNGNSPIEGQGREICTYGPWVADYGHSRRPEIHPSELIWWRVISPVDGGRTYRMLLVQDDSNRFDRISRGDKAFKVTSPPPSWWRPWAQPVRRGEFKIAFELNPGLSTLFFHINDSDRRNVVTAGHSDGQDATAGSEHSIRLDGQTILTAKEHQPDGDLGVTFSDVCRNAAGTRIQGYVVLRSRVGVDDHGEEGFHEIWVRETGNGSVVWPGDPPVATADAVIAVDKGSLVLDGELLADLVFEIPPHPELTAADMAVTGVVLLAADGTRQELQFELRTEGDEKAPTIGTVFGVPMIAGPRIEISTLGGWSLEKEAYGATLHAAALPYQEAGEAAGEEAWLSIVAAAQGEPTSPPLPVVRLASSRLAPVARYAPNRSEGPSPEEGSPLTEVLDEALAEGDRERLEQLFGTPEPVTSSWTFEAKDHTTGEPMPVVAGAKAPAGAVAVEEEPGSLGVDALTVHFPEEPAEHLIELTARLTVEDPFGTKSEREWSLWSHGLLAEDAAAAAEALLPALAEMSGADAGELVAAAYVDPGEHLPVQEDARQTAARILRLQAEQGSLDGYLGVDELADLASLARYFAGLSGGK